MKKLTIKSVMAVLWSFAKHAERPHKLTERSKFKGYFALTLLLLMLWQNLFAQENKSATKTKGMQVGEQMLNVILNDLYGYKDDNGKTTTTVKLSNFKGKLVILDFWATWCAPCIAMIPKMDSLQKQFKNKVQFISVTYQSRSDVLPFLEKLEKQNGNLFTVPQVFGDKELNQLFPHVYLPHYVWIDGNGVIRAITDATAITAKEIEHVLTAENYKPVQKKDYRVKYDRNSPLFYNGNGGSGAESVYNTMLSTYVDGLGSGVTLNPPLIGKQGFSKILVHNLGLINLFSIAIGGGKKLYVNNRILLETKDSLTLSPLMMKDNWQPYTWCYEMKLPTALQANGYELMYADLCRLFGQYNVRLEKRLVTCYALKRIEGMEIPLGREGVKIIKHDPTGLELQNYTLKLFINTLALYYYYDSPVPIIDLTGYTKNLDLKINAPLNNITAVNDELRSYGLEFVKDKFEIDMIVFKDVIK